jgi:hypothetical protein
MGWKNSIDRSEPGWRDYLDLINALPDEKFPGCEALNELHEARAGNRAGKQIRFVPGTRMAATGYEAHIFANGEVPTRADNWHDLCNALVWMRLPATKAALNALHIKGMAAETGSRGSLRDALTLFDESGAIVLSTDEELLQALAARDWETAFQSQRAAWDTATQVIVCGHAILEKLLQPYKAITAHCLLIRATADTDLSSLDTRLGEALVAGELLTSNQHLAPLPLAGIPGWWRSDNQDASFYADERVFRSPPPDLHPPPSFNI